MRVLALGGAGAMGTVAVRRLMTHPDVESIVIADHDVERASALAEKVRARAGDRERRAFVSATRADVADSVVLTSLVSQADVVLNTTGPYYRHGVAVLAAAIDAGAHYLDICDDPAPTMEMLELDRRARDADVLAVVGMGASPGVSNLLARVAADRLDRVDDIVTGWPEDPSDEIDPAHPVSAAAVHWVHQCAHAITVLRNGALTKVAPLEPIDLTYPEVGSGRVYTVGHPEAVTLHRAYPDLRSSTNVMVITPALHRVLVEVAGLVGRGLTDSSAARALVQRIAATDLAADGPAAPFGWLFAVATGVADEVPTAVAAGLTAYPPGGMAGITGLPLALATEMLCEGLLTARGVHPPETAVPPTEFLARLAPVCEGAPDVDDLVRITRSPA